ncbi:hypothetical protein [Saccharopolyspora sp. ASAGF58]|uniref:hypothetical protein n=1 Tax=Saccharopolyspora sp. ASAGF58 TaxID=2719023 RepID=UPI00143FFEC9|nr:hypothetical protein [Saccharopolyspora sp. ASAGF58]QIZ33437.1 hypothetical protein FDZ84_00085 [Saccharopolyspora sp. ASAGF58]
MSQDALSEVGLRNPGGDAQALYRSAQGWADLSAYLCEHSARVAEITGVGLQKWTGDAADAFTDRMRGVVHRAERMAQTTEVVAAQQEQHARKHVRVTQIIVELAVLIAATLAFYAAAAMFPALLAWAQAWLAYLVSTGVRVLQLLAQALRVLVDFLVRTRTWIAEVSQLTWKSERLSVGYGRILVEGVRDMGIDLAANLTASGLLGKKIDPAQVFISAGVSGLGGAFVGGLEKSGISKVLDGAGNARRGSDGLPEFVTFESQAKNFVMKIGPAPKQKPPNPPPSESERLLDNVKTAYDNAANLGIKDTPDAGRRLADELTLARNNHRNAVAEHTIAVDELSRAVTDVATRERAVLVHREAVDQAMQRVGAASTRLDLYRASGNPEWIQDGVQQLDAARRALAEASGGLREAQNALDTSRQGLLEWQRNVQTARDAVARSEAAHDLARFRADAWDQLDAARIAARDQTTFRQRLAFVRNNNAWGASFGSRNSWQEILFYDVPKDAINGMTSGAVKSGIEVARGNGQPGDMWKGVLLQGATGALRGGVNSAASNTAFPRSGVGETLWKTGSKTADIHARSSIEANTYGKASAGHHRKDVSRMPRPQGGEEARSTSA